MSQKCEKEPTIKAKLIGTSNRPVIPCLSPTTLFKPPRCCVANLTRMQIQPPNYIASTPNLKRIDNKSCSSNAIIKLKAKNY